MWLKRFNNFMQDMYESIDSPWNDIIMAAMGMALGTAITLLWFKIIRS